MGKNTRVFLRGAELRTAIAAMSAPVLKYVLRADLDSPDARRSFEVSKEIACLMVKTGNFEGLLRRGRVIKIWDLDTRRPQVHDASFRDGRATLQFVPITRKTVKIWDQYFLSRQSPSVLP